jgi:hypothetical protein
MPCYHLLNIFVPISIKNSPGSYGATSQNTPSGEVRKAGLIENRNIFESFLLRVKRVFAAGHDGTPKNKSTIRTRCHAIRFFFLNKNHVIPYRIRNYVIWGVEDSNLRRLSQQIYRLHPLFSTLI